MNDILEELLSLARGDGEEADMLWELLARAERTALTAQEQRESGAARQAEGMLPTQAERAPAEEQEAESTPEEVPEEAALERVSRSMEGQGQVTRERRDLNPEGVAAVGTGGEEETQVQRQTGDIQSEDSETEQARVLAEQLGSADRAADYVRRESPSAPQREADTGWVRLEETAAARAEDVRRVDRAFERDARRYDCGFTLF